MKSYFLATVIITSRGTMSSLDDVRLGWERGNNEAEIIAAQGLDVTVVPRDGDDSVVLGFADDTYYACGKHIKDVVRVLYEELVQAKTTIDVTRKYKTEE